MPDGKNEHFLPLSDFNFVGLQHTFELQKLLICRFMVGPPYSVNFLLILNLLFFIVLSLQR